MRTELPEKWIIKRNPEVNEWMVKVSGRNYYQEKHNEEYKYLSFRNYLNFTGDHFCVKLEDSYIELTFEEFKTLVLNKNNEPQYEIY